MIINLSALSLYKKDKVYYCRFYGYYGYYGIFRVFYGY